MHSNSRPLPGPTLSHFPSRFTFVPVDRQGALLGTRCSYSGLDVLVDAKKFSCAGETAAHAFKYAAWFTLSVLLSQVTMYVIYWLSGSPGARFWQTGDTENLGVFVVLTLLCTAGVWISNHAVAVLYRQQFRGAIAAALLAAGLLLFTADHFSHLSVKLMNHYGVGDNQTYDVIVSDKGQGLVDTLGLKPCSKNLLCKVQILSKIGDKYYLKIGDTEYVTLPKEDVIATRQVKD